MLSGINDGLLPEKNCNLKDKTSTVVDGGRYYQGSTMGCCQRKTATEKTRQVQLLMVGDIIRDHQWVVARENLQLKRQDKYSC